MQSAEQEARASALQSQSELATASQMYQEHQQNVANWHASVCANHSTASQGDREQQRQQAEMEGVDGPEMPEVEEVTYAQLIQEGLMESVSVPVQRIKMCVIMGNKYSIQQSEES